MDRYDLIGAGARVKGDILRETAAGIRRETEELDRARLSGAGTGFRLGDWGGVSATAYSGAGVGVGVRRTAEPSPCTSVASGSSHLVAVPLTGSPGPPSHLQSSRAAQPPDVRPTLSSGSQSQLQSHGAGLGTPAPYVPLDLGPLHSDPFRLKLDRVSRALEEMRPVPYDTPAFSHGRVSPPHMAHRVYEEAQPVGTEQQQQQQQQQDEAARHGAAVEDVVRAASEAPPSVTHARSPEHHPEAAAGDARELVAECLGSDSEVDEVLLHSALFGERDKGRKHRGRRRRQQHGYDAALLVKAALRMGLRNNPASLGGFLESVDAGGLQGHTASLSRRHRCASPDYRTRSQSGKRTSRSRSRSASHTRQY